MSSLRVRWPWASCLSSLSIQNFLRLCTKKGLCFIFSLKNNFTVSCPLVELYWQTNNQRYEFLDIVEWPLWKRNLCPWLVHSFNPFSQHVCQLWGVMGANNRMCSLCCDGRCLWQRPGRWHSLADRAGMDQARWAPNSAWKGQQVLSCSQLLPQGNPRQPWPEIPVIWREARNQLSHRLSSFSNVGSSFEKLTCHVQTKQNLCAL